MDNNVVDTLREGQNIRVFQKIVEGKRERNVPFTGVILKVRGIGVNKMITVKQTLENIDVEKIFPLALPTITKIEVVEEKKVMRKSSAGKKSRKAKSTSSKSKKKGKK